MFSSLRHKNFRLYLSGQFISLIGTWMQQLATSWMVYRLTNSSLWLGIAVFSSQIPMFAIGLFAGVFVDRVNRHKLLLWTQSLSAVQAFALAILTFTGKMTLAELIGLSVVLGIINAFDMPARQSFVIEMIGEKKDLPNAIALNSSVMNGTRLIGPAIAGAAIAMVGEGVCFLLNALSYLAVLYALMQMTIDRTKIIRSNEPLKKSLKIGFDSALRNPPIRHILFILAFISLFGMPYITLFPALAGQVKGGNAGTLGYITAAAGFGALIGALYLARRRGVPLLGKVMAVSGLGFGAGLVLLSFAHQLPLILFCVFLNGLSMMLQMASGNTVIQSLVEDEKRGRVMSIFTFSLLGVAPFGALLMGWVAERIGLDRAILVNGILVLIGAALFARTSSVINHHVNLRFSA